MTHFEAVELVANHLTNEIVISSVGNTNRELYSVKKYKLALYGVQMSLATPLAYGLAKGIPGRKVVVLDGDGSLLMGLGVLATIATNPANNLVMIALDNGCYAACGWYPSATGKGTDLAGIARSAGIHDVWSVDNSDELSAALTECLQKNEPVFIRAKVESGPLPKPLEPLPFDTLEGTYRFRQALVEEGLVEEWHDVVPIHYTFGKGVG